MDGAATKGLLDIVQQLHYHRMEGCSSRAFTGAAANNHLQVLQWLRDVYPEVSDAMEEIVAAAQHGHHHVVGFLRARLNREELQRPLEVAAANGHVAVLEVLLPWAIGDNGGAFDAAAENGHVAALKLLLERDQVGGIVLDSGLKKAVEREQLKAVEFLVSVADDFTIQAGLSTVVATGSTEVAKLILEKINLDDTLFATALVEAAKLDHCEMVELLLDKVVPVGVEPAFDLEQPASLVDLAMHNVLFEGARNGRVEMVKLVVTKCGLFAGRAIEHALAYRQRGVVMLLLQICQAGQLIQGLHDSTLKTLLENAVTRGDVEMVSLITSKFSAFSAGCALDLAVLHKHRDIVEILATRAKSAQKVNAFRGGSNERQRRDGPSNSGTKRPGRG